MKRRCAWAALLLRPARRPGGRAGHAWIAPTVAPIRPAPWSSRYQPMVWLMKVATKAPAMPSSVVRMKPLGSFGPGERKRAMMPAMNPITMIQMMFDTTLSCDFDAGVRPSTECMPFKAVQR